MFWAGQDNVCRGQEHAHDCTSSRVTARNCAWLYTAAFTGLPTAAHFFLPEVLACGMYYLYLYFVRVRRRYRRVRLRGSRLSSERLR